MRLSSKKQELEQEKADKDMYQRQFALLQQQLSKQEDYSKWREQLLKAQEESRKLKEEVDV